MIDHKKIHTVGLTIRPAMTEDLDEIQKIYNHFVRTSVYTMDLEEKSYADMVEWLDSHSERFPIYVGIRDDKVIGIVSLSKWAERKGFYPSCEISIYLSPCRKAQGYGNNLLQYMIQIAKKNKFTTIVSFITSTNKLAKNLAIKNNFIFVGTIKQVGFKFNRSIDLDIYQLMIHQTTGNTAYQKIDNALSHYDWYMNYRKNRLERSDYLKYLLQFKQKLMDTGLSEDEIHLSTRFSLNDEQTVDYILNDLRNRKMISSVDYPKDKFDLLAQKISQEFIHKSCITYIFPEESRLLYALTYITKPETMLFLGSYYGYWAIWATILLKETNGVAYLVDTDQHMLALAEKNMKKFQCDSVVKYINEDAIQFLAREKIPHDFIVLDPEGPKEGADPDLLDKAIYYPMMKAAHPYLTKDGIILCHNILLTNPILEDPYFAKKIEYNNIQFSKFLPFMMEHYTAGVWYDTTEGVGVFSQKK